MTFKIGSSVWWEKIKRLLGLGNKPVSFYTAMSVEKECGVLGRVILPSPFDAKNKYWLNFKRRAKRNGYSLPKQAVVDTIKGQLLLALYWDDKKPILAISMSCGSKVEYQTFDDIPDKDVPCPCGDPTHWFIKYEFEDRRKKKDE